MHLLQVMFQRCAQLLWEWGPAAVPNPKCRDCWLAQQERWSVAPAVPLMAQLMRVQCRQSLWVKQGSIKSRCKNGLAQRVRWVSTWLNRLKLRRMEGKRKLLFYLCLPCPIHRVCCRGKCPSPRCAPSSLLLHSAEGGHSGCNQRANGVGGERGKRGKKNTSCWRSE